MSAEQDSMDVDATGASAAATTGTSTCSGNTSSTAGGGTASASASNAAANAANAAAAAAAQEKTIKCHPLALIAITDHQTRAATGGSALLPGSPVVGLLFGHQDGLTVSILDAIEMEHSFAAAAAAVAAAAAATAEARHGEFGGGSEAEQAQHRAALRTKIELHRKVFPTHEVVGWYRVATGGGGADGGGDGEDAEEEGPTEQDLRTNNGKMKDLNESPLFLLMDAGPPSSSSSGDGKKKANADNTSNNAGREEDGGGSAGQTAREKLDRDEQLPVAIYESLVTVDQAAVFVNLEFELETFEPERIAVENVFKAQRQVVPTAAAAAASPASTSAPAPENDTKMPSVEDAQKDPAGALAALKSRGAAGDAASAPVPAAAAAAAAAPIPPSELDAHFQTMRSSIESMNDRVSVLLDYLRGVESGAISDPDPGLLRQVDALVRRLPLLQTGQSRGLPGEFEAEHDSAVMLAYLAALTKTARAVRVATDKTLLAIESKNVPRIM
jgi:hypothetical protein